ncbi:MAG TPA: SH3 domain-containing protein [Candidatus Limiplasma sp.]|nr:SH3 domain-containing protein [Candidatus Limiplasma sp.]
MMKHLLKFLLTGLLLCLSATAAAWGPQNDIQADALPAEAQAVLESGTFVQAIEELPYLYLVTENTDTTRTLTVFQQTTDGFAAVAASAPLPAMNGAQPSIIATTQSVTILYSEALLYTFHPETDGVWRLTYVQGEHDYRCTKYWLIEQNVERSRLLCGADTSAALSQFDPAAFPPDFDAAAKTLDTDGYALVDNPDPADRLNLRAEPDKSAASLGKYYNGTPVRITEELGEWVKVSIAGAEGYMMQKYLAFGTDMLHVESAFPDLFLSPTLYGQDLNVYLLPAADSGVAGVLADCSETGTTVTVIGVVGDDWVHVICADGLAGYMPAEDFYPGNG